MLAVLLSTFMTYLVSIKSMERTTALFLLIALVSSCVTHDFPNTNTCFVGDPVEQLDWLQDQIREINNYSLSRYSYIIQATYHGETVFFSRNCCPACLSAPPQVLNCEGQPLFSLDAERQSEIRNEQIIWRGANFACTV